MSVTVSHKKFSLKLHELGFYQLDIFNHVEVGIEDVKMIVAAQRKLSGEKMPVLAICAEFASTNSDVMRYISKNENFPYSKAGAFVIKSMAQKLLANFYLKINVPQRPTKFFNSKEEAEKWLQQFK